MYKNKIYFYYNHHVRFYSNIYNAQKELHDLIFSHSICVDKYTQKYDNFLIGKQPSTISSKIVRNIFNTRMSL